MSWVQAPGPGALRRRASPRRLDPGHRCLRGGALRSRRRPRTGRGRRDGVADRATGQGAVMGYYPIFIEMRDRPVLVVGGGDVAERKVEGLLAAGAAVTVVSPSLTPRLATLAASGRIRHEARPYQTGDLACFALGFVATGDERVNAAVAREGRRRGMWVNADRKSTRLNSSH